MEVIDIPYLPKLAVFDDSLRLGSAVAVAVALQSRHRRKAKNCDRLSSCDSPRSESVMAIPCAQRESANALRNT